MNGPAAAAFSSPISDDKGDKEHSRPRITHALSSVAAPLVQKGFREQNQYEYLAALSEWIRFCSAIFQDELSLLGRL